MNNFVLPMGYAWEGDKLVIRVERDNVPDTILICMVADKELMAKFVGDVAVDVAEGRIRLAHLMAHE